MAVTLCELLWLVDNRGELEAHKTNCRNWLSMFHKPTSLLPWTDARTSPGKKIERVENANFLPKAPV